MVIAFAGPALRLWRANVATAEDRESKKHRGRVLRGDRTAVPPVGTYHSGHKLVFWAMVGSLAVLLVSGFIFRRPYVAGCFGIGLLRAAALLHPIAAVVLIASAIVHVFAAIWIKGRTRAMTRGTVSDGWARTNHPLRHKGVTGGR